MYDSLIGGNETKISEKILIAIFIICGLIFLVGVILLIVHHSKNEEEKKTSNLEGWGLGLILFSVLAPCFSWLIYTMYSFVNE